MNPVITAIRNNLSSLLLKGGDMNTIDSLAYAKSRHSLAKLMNDVSEIEKCHGHVMYFTQKAAKERKSLESHNYWRTWIKLND